MIVSEEGGRYVTLVYSMYNTQGSIRGEGRAYKGGKEDGGKVVYQDTIGTYILGELG